MRAEIPLLFADWKYAGGRQRYRGRDLGKTDIDSEGNERRQRRPQGRWGRDCFSGFWRWGSAYHQEMCRENGGPGPEICTWDLHVRRLSLLNRTRLCT